MCVCTAFIARTWLAAWSMRVYMCERVCTHMCGPALIEFTLCLRVFSAHARARVLNPPPSHRNLTFSLPRKFCVKLAAVSARTQRHTVAHHFAYPPILAASSSPPWRNLYRTAFNNSFRIPPYNRFGNQMERTAASGADETPQHTNTHTNKKINCIISIEMAATQICTHTRTCTNIYADRRSGQIQHARESCLLHIYSFDSSICGICPLTAQSPAAASRRRSTWPAPGRSSSCRRRISSGRARRCSPTTL